MSKMRLRGVRKYGYAEFWVVSRPPATDAGSQRASADEASSATGFLVTDRFPFICCFKIADGLNTTTRRDEIGATVPVFGLRPMRCFFFRAMKMRA
jgi:hypothetical protein